MIYPCERPRVGPNVVELGILELLPPSSTPFIGRSFSDSGLRGPDSLGPVVPDSCNRLEDLREDCRSRLRIIGHQNGGFRSQGHDGVLELIVHSPRAMHPGGDHHEGSGNDRHDDHGKELLADTVGSLAMKLLDLKGHFVGSVMVLHRPAPKVELDDLLSLKTALVEHVGQKHRDLPLGAHQPDRPELDAPGFFPLLGAEPLDVSTGRGKRNVTFLPAALDESLDSGKGRFGRTAKEKVPFVVLSQIGNQLKARVSPLEKQDALGRNQRQERLRLLPLRSVDADHTSGYGKTPENIIGRRNQALRIVTPSFILKAALRIELGSDLPGCWKGVLRSIEGDDRHTVPDIGGIARKEALGKLERFHKDVPEEMVQETLASMGECAAVDLLGIGPKSASPGPLETNHRL